MKMAFTIESVGAMLQSLAATQFSKDDGSAMRSEVSAAVTQLDQRFSKRMDDIERDAANRQAMRDMERVADEQRLVRLENITAAAAEELRQIACANRESWPVVKSLPVNPAIGEGAHPG